MQALHLTCFHHGTLEGAIPLTPLSPEILDAWLETQALATRHWLEVQRFKAKPHSLCLLPDAAGRLARVLVGLDQAEPMWSIAALPEKLPAGVYYLDADWPQTQRVNLAIGWGLGSYRFNRYKKTEPLLSQLALPEGPDAFTVAEIAQVENTVSAHYWVRDLINLPAVDMSPVHLGQAGERLASEFGAQCTQIIGERLVDAGYPLVHAVGRASQNAPRVLDLRWGEPTDFKLTLIGKGVCFDSGGLDLKPSKGMRWMKKDMGGAAHVLGLARMIMAANLPVCLRVLVAAAENMVSANAFKPGDVLLSRQGLSIEIDNTDAEGRLLLCDLLCAAAEEAPDLMIDFATLTGAARVAVGTEIAAFFSNDDTLADALMHHAKTPCDPLWRLPLHAPYKAMLDSDIADLANSSESGYAGAITAALFLQAFVRHRPWVHFDIMAWNTRQRPGRPKGGEAMGLRTVFAWLNTTLAQRRSLTC